MRGASYHSIRGRSLHRRALRGGGSIGGQRLLPCKLHAAAAANSWYPENGSYPKADNPRCRAKGIHVWDR